MEKVPFIDLYTKEKADVLDQIFEDFRTVVEKSQFILGDPVAEFEEGFAKLSQCRFGVGCNSGLDALILALRALKIGAGDEVITAPNSFIASAAAIALVGAKPVFADVAIDYNINPVEIEKVVTKSTKAIMPVHLTGNPCKMDEILAIARKHNLRVIEDAAQAVGATYHGKAVGGFGDVGAFSLHPLKNLHVWGDGGMMTLNSEELMQQLKLQRNHGLKNRDEVEFYSYNSRLDTFQAVVGLNFLRLLGQTTEARRRHAAIYTERLQPLAEWLSTPVYEANKVKHVFHVYQVRATDRNELKDFLAKRGIETKVHYPIPIHWQKATEYLGYRKGDFPVTDRLAEEILSLPVRENLSDDTVNHICDVISEFYRGRA